MMLYRQALLAREDELSLILLLKVPSKVHVDSSVLDADLGHGGIFLKFIEVPASLNCCGFNTGLTV